MTPRNIDHCVSSSEDCAIQTKEIENVVQRARDSVSTSTICPTTTLCALVAIDNFSVSLVVPLMHQYFKNAGVQSASQREMLSSLYSSSQIAGGLIIGALSDVGLLSRRKILFLSFLGSALSYGLIVVGGLRKLIFSRVLVGLVKQTMTVSTSLLARCTTSENRAVSMGRLAASSTAAWIVGPSVGALLYKHVDPSAPAIAAVCLFIFNSAVAAILLPIDNESGNDDSASKSQSSLKEGGKIASFTSNLKACFSSSALASAITSLLLLGWVIRTTSYANMASFYEEKYGIEPHIRGYIKSYQQSLSFLFQSFFVRALLTASGGEKRAAVIASFLVAGATLCEVKASFKVFLCLVCPAISISVQMVSVSLRSLVTQVTPKESIGSVLAALDVLQNAASVTVPFYRTLLFKLVAYYGSEDGNASMVGDPVPRLWLLSSFLHW
eukprot:CAMPEP_0172539966 /NCGR_PEP_ID=MMETSP1067-20121228/11061_1 /TAXON_ID=265564 ORGANISM="Thalassiosira punctigera, Strain Tpunct2005C2" /NCGR_SAMPLE_ID=MMETSP1067 /ASSEMBLY_ACC=CAM_ASM_000444 /LENGTH=439 /DNA_ID=CAMNT_0013325735 /DNA_START=93 /DNA_END=1409 /DNA_ORIENTATION=+